MKSRNKTLLFGMVGLLHFLGTFLLLAPDIYDNVFYFNMGQFLEKYKAYLDAYGNTTYVWPPVLPAILSIPHFLGLHSLVVSKLVIVGFFLGSLYMVYQLFLSENRPFAMLTCIVFALIPTGVMMSSRVMSEWPMIFFCYVVLFVLSRIDITRDLKWAILGGVFAALAILTRYQAMALAFPIGYQLIRHWHEAKNRTKQWFDDVFPTLSVGWIAAVVFMGWIIVIKYFVAKGATVDTVYYQGLNHFSYYMDNVSTIHIHLSKLLFRSMPVIHNQLWGALFFCLYGVVVHIRTRGILASDIFVLGCFITIMSVYILNRYLLVIAPFLIYYFLMGLYHSLAFLKDPNRIRLWFRGVVGCWLILITLSDIGYLLYGNVETYRGLVSMIKYGKDTYYMGEWRDIYLLSRQIKLRDNQSVVYFDDRLGGKARYISVFSQHFVKPMSEKNKPFPYLAIIYDDNMFFNVGPIKGDTAIGKIPMVSIYSSLFIKPVAAYESDRPYFMLFYDKTDYPLMGSYEVLDQRNGLKLLRVFGHSS